MVQQRYTLSELADLLGVTYQTILNMKRTGKFRTVKIGGRYYIPQEEVNRLTTQGNADRSNDVSDLWED